MLNLRSRKGRWPVLTEGQESTLWEQWRSRVKAAGIMLHEHTAMLNVAMDLAEAHCLPLSVIWNAIRDWLKRIQAEPRWVHPYRLMPGHPLPQAS